MKEEVKNEQELTYEEAIKKASYRIAIVTLGNLRDLLW